QDPGAALRTDHGVVRVLQHCDSVSHADSQGTAGSPFTNHDTDDRRPKSRHHKHRVRDGHGLAAFFGTDSWVGTWGVDKGYDRQLVFGRQLHLLDRFAVALWVGAAKVALTSFFEIPPFEVSGEQHFVAVDFREPGPQRPV